MKNITSGQFKMIAKTQQGLEPLLEKELLELGAVNTQRHKRAVSFEGNKRLLYKVNLHSRLSLKILVPFFNFKAINDKQLYDAISSINWDDLLSVNGTLAVDGLLLVHSRTALLDLFLTFFTLLGVFLWHRNRHVWAGIAFGFAIGCKWSAIYFVAVIGLLAVYRILIAHDIRKAIKPIAAKFAQYGLLPVFIYMLTWTGWFISDRGWSRQWSNNPLASWFHYHSEMLNFHTGLTEQHPYQANPWSWLIMGRPTSFFYASPQGCEAKDCAQEVLALGTPILWWVGTIAIAVVIGYWIKSLILRHSDSALNIVVLGIAAGYLPWFAMQQRTAFSFYAIIFEPFMIVAIVYCAKLLLDSGLKPVVSQSIVGGIFALILLCFLFFIPLFTGQIITYEDWRLRMWFDSWI